MEIPEFRIEDFTLEEDFLKEGDQANVFKGLHSTHGYYTPKHQFILMSGKSLLKNGFLLLMI